MTTYSLSPLDSATLNFLLDFMGPCLTWHFGISNELGTCSSGGSVDSLSPSSKNCLAVLALSHMMLAWEGHVSILKWMGWPHTC